MDPNAYVVRARAVAGLMVSGVSGTNEQRLHQEGFYSFELDPLQFSRFKQWFEKYIPDHIRASVRVEEEYEELRE